MSLLLSTATTDLTHRLIPNTITFSASMAGLIYHVLSQPAATGLFFSAAGLLAGGFLLWIPYRLSWTGGGDVKLLAALGAWIGPYQIVHVFVYSSIVGGFLAAIQLARKHNRFGKIQASGGVAIGGHHKKNETALPYALAISGGYIVFLSWGELF